MEFQTRQLLAYSGRTLFIHYFSGNIFHYFKLHFWNLLVYENWRNNSQEKNIYNSYQVDLGVNNVISCQPFFIAPYVLLNILILKNNRKFFIKFEQDSILVNTNIERKRRSYQERQDFLSYYLRKGMCSKLHSLLGLKLIQDGLFSSVLSANMALNASLVQNRPSNTNSNSRTPLLFEETSLFALRTSDTSVLYEVK